MQKKIYCAVGAGLCATLAPVAVLTGQSLAGPQRAFAAEPSVSLVAPNADLSPSVQPSPVQTGSEQPSPSQASSSASSGQIPSPATPTAPVTTASPSPRTSSPVPTSLESTSPAPTSAAPTASAPAPSAEPSSPLPSAPTSEPSEEPLPSPVPSESASTVPQPPSESPNPEVTGAAAGLFDPPANAPSAQPPTGIDRGSADPAAGAASDYKLPSTLAHSVAGTQNLTRMGAAVTDKGENFPVNGTVLGNFSSNQQGVGYAGAPEWVEGFLNAAAQEKSSSSVDTNQAAGVTGAEAQERQAGAITGSSSFQRGDTIMNGARPLVIFTGIAAAGLTLVVFNFVWRNRRSRN